MEELTPDAVDEVFILYSARIPNPEDTPGSSPVPVDNGDQLEFFPVFFPKDFRVIKLIMTIVNIKRVKVTFYQDTPDFVVTVPIEVST